MSQSSLFLLWQGAAQVGARVDLMSKCQKGDKWMLLQNFSPYFDTPVKSLSACNQNKLLACTPSLSPRSLGFYRSDNPDDLPVFLCPQHIAQVHRTGGNSSNSHRTDRTCTEDFLCKWKKVVEGTSLSHVSEGDSKPSPGPVAEGFCCQPPKSLYLSMLQSVTLGWEFLPQPQPGVSHGGEGGELG